MPQNNLLQLMGIPTPVTPPPPEHVVTTRTTNYGGNDYDDDENQDGLNDEISILPSHSWDNIVIDLSKATFKEIESRLNFGANQSHGGATDVANVKINEHGQEEEEEGRMDNYTDDSDDDDDNNSQSLSESDLNPLLEILLRGKNDDIDEETMLQSMSIYRKLLKPTFSGSVAATAGGSVDGITTFTAGGIIVHEGSLVYAVRKKYSDENMMELMNMLFDAIEETNNGNFNNAVDGRRILGLALIYGNVGASRVIIERYPDSLNTRDDLRGQLPLHVATHVGLIVEDDEEEDDCFSVATGRSSVIRRKRRKDRQAELIQLLITEGIKQKVGGNYGAGGLYEQDEFGTTPLMQLIHSLNNPFTWDDGNYDVVQNFVPLVDIHASNGSSDDADVNTTAATTRPISKNRPLANLEICIKAAWESRGPNNFFPILHEAINISSPDAFYRILEIVKYYDNELCGVDQRGRTALVKAIYIDKIIQRRTSTRDIIRMILNGVSNECATLRDGADRLPLHIAAEMGLKWEDGLRDIIDANYQALEEPHPVSKLYPFALAAQACPGSIDLDTLYRIIRERPKLIVVAKRKNKDVQSEAKDLFLHLSEVNSRPLSPSVHRPLVFQSHRDRNISETGSDQTTPTVTSSSTIGVGNKEPLSFDNIDTRTSLSNSLNPFDDNY